MLSVLAFLSAALSCWPVMESTKPDAQPVCSDGRNWDNCRCDALCAQYGDCCVDAPSFVPEQQRRGASPFICDSTNVYMMASCPAEYNDAITRFHCEHPDTSYRDPLLDVPITSNHTKITYRNSYCALCHNDLDVGTSDIWSIYFTCDNVWLNNRTESIINYVMYNTETLSWVVNVTTHPELLIFNDNPSTLLYNCSVGVWPPEFSHLVLRTCDSSTIDTCPEDWTDEGVLDQCMAYTAHVCFYGIVYRNHYCGICNNNGTFDGSDCVTYDIRVMVANSPPDFTLLLNWRGLREREMCQQDTEAYDPFIKACRNVFREAAYSGREDYRSASNNETSASSLDTCLKIRLGAHEYNVEDNDTMIVFISMYNMNLKPHEYKIDNDSQLIMCLPEFVLKFGPGAGYITVIGVSLSILFLVLHLAVFVMTPKLRNLSSMNLASLSVALLTMYCTFLIGFCLTNSSIPCVVMAVIIHYTLLASFCWMLTIAYDVNRVLKQTTTKLLLSTGKHWMRFGCYSLWSWMFPAAVVGAALAANFSTDSVLAFLRPGYGTNVCYISKSVALVVFTVTPLLIIMVLNAVFFVWSACLIQITKSELGNATRTHTHFSLYARLALIMGLTWAVGLIAGYVDVPVVWYAFVALNTLQGLFIFLAFTCSQKVWHSLSVALGLQRDKKTQGPKSAFTTGTTSTWA